MATSVNGMKLEMVDMKEALSDPSAEVLAESEASVDAIPDLDILTSNIIEILEYLDKPEVVQMCRHNDSAVRMTLINKYADSVPLRFIDLFMEKDPVHKRESVERTMKFIETLARIKSGEADLETESKKFVEEINHRYVYSKYGGKEKFERALKKELSKDHKNIAKSRVG